MRAPSLPRLPRGQAPGRARPFVERGLVLSHQGDSGTDNGLRFRPHRPRLGFGEKAARRQRVDENAHPRLGRSRDGAWGKSRGRHYPHRLRRGARRRGRIRRRRRLRGPPVSRSGVLRVCLPLRLADARGAPAAAHAAPEARLRRVLLGRQGLRRGRRLRGGRPFGIAAPAARPQPRLVLRFRRRYRHLVQPGGHRGFERGLAAPRGRFVRRVCARGRGGRPGRGFASRQDTRVQPALRASRLVSVLAAGRRGRGPEARQLGVRGPGLGAALCGVRGAGW
mmetsp:Transcript_25470/g.87398  ORF Transcript_25470/g.87398 Transcript_25470/m.87398 type:complete len:280 (+) Transcript_25470:386-1225(+)